MESIHSKAVDGLFEAILQLKDIDECYKFFEDACTVREIMDISQRFEVAKMLDEGGKSYLEISKETGASSATITRINRCLKYGTGGYRIVIERTKKDNG